VIGRILAHRHQVAAAAASSLMEGRAAHRARGPLSEPIRQRVLAICHCLPGIVVLLL